MSQVVENNGSEVEDVKKEKKKDYWFDEDKQCVVYSNKNSINRKLNNKGSNDSKNNNSNSGNHNNVIEFIFYITRQKSMETLKETLIIKVTDISSKIVYAEITTNVIKLSDRLVSLNEYGVVLSRYIFDCIEKEIKANYNLLKINYIHTELVLDDDKLREIISMVIDYASEIGNLEYEVNGKVCYNIPVADFSSLIKDSEYKDFDLLEIKKELKNSKYTICSTGRYDRTIYNSDTKKAIKVISFDKKYILESVKGDK